MNFLNIKVFFPLSTFNFDFYFQLYSKSKAVTIPYKEIFDNINVQLF